MSVCTCSSASADAEESNQISCRLFQEHNTIINSFPPGQNGCYFTDNIFRCIFVNEKFCILIWISLKYVPKGTIDNESILAQVMAWRWPGDKPWSEPMLTQFNDALGGDELIMTFTVFPYMETFEIYKNFLHIMPWSLIKDKSYLM